MLALTRALNQYGVPGLFLLSYISNAIPGFPAVYLVVIGSYALVAGDAVDASTAILASGAGAGLGKLTVFLSSRALGHASKRAQRLREQTEWLGEEAERGIFILVLIFAWLPLPDDILYIPLGLTGFKVLAFSIAVVTGKIMLTATVYLLASAYRSFADSLLAAQTQENTGLLVGGMLAASAAASIIIFKMDWRKIYSRYKSEGPLKAMVTLTLELIRVLTFNTVDAEKNPSRRYLAALAATVALGAAAGWLLRGWPAALLLGSLAPILLSMLVWLAKRTPAGRHLGELLDD